MAWISKHPFGVFVVALFAGQAVFLYPHWSRGTGGADADAGKEPTLLGRIHADPNAAEIDLGEYYETNDSFPDALVLVHATVVALVDEADQVAFTEAYDKEVGRQRTKARAVVSSILRKASDYELHEPGQLTIKRKLRAALNRLASGADPNVRTVQDIVIGPFDVRGG